MGSVLALFPLQDWQVAETDRLPIEMAMVIAQNIDDGQPWHWPHKCYLLVVADNGPEAVVLRGLGEDLYWESVVRNAPWASPRARALIRDELSQFHYHRRPGRE